MIFQHKSFQRCNTAFCLLQLFIISLAFMEFMSSANLSYMSVHVHICRHFTGSIFEMATIVTFLQNLPFYVDFEIYAHKR